MALVRIPNQPERDIRISEVEAYTSLEQTNEEFDWYCRAMGIMPFICVNCSVLNLTPLAFGACWKCDQWHSDIF